MTATRLFTLFLRILPKSHRIEFASEMIEVFEDGLREARTPRASIRHLSREILDVARVAWAMRAEPWKHRIEAGLGGALHPLAMGMVGALMGCSAILGYAVGVQRGLFLPITYAILPIALIAAAWSVGRRWAFHDSGVVRLRGAVVTAALVLVSIPVLQAIDDLGVRALGSQGVEWQGSIPGLSFETAYLENAPSTRPAPPLRPDQKPEFLVTNLFSIGSHDTYYWTALAEWPDSPPYGALAMILGALSTTLGYTRARSMRLG